MQGSPIVGEHLPSPIVNYNGAGLWTIRPTIVAMTIYVSRCIYNENMCVVQINMMNMENYKVSGLTLYI